jgi:hypothetical protein
MAKQPAKKAGSTPRVRRPVARKADLEPRYQVLQVSYINGGLYGPNQPLGDEVVYYGVPGRYLKPLHAAAKANKAAAKDVRQENSDDPDVRATELRSLDNDLQGVKPKNPDDDFDDDEDELTDADRRELEAHAAQTQADTEQYQREQGFTGVKLMGNPANPGHDPVSAQQAATPVTDGKQSSAK